MPPEPAVGRTGSVSNGSVIRRAGGAHSWKLNLVKPWYWHTCGRLLHPFGSPIHRPMRTRCQGRWLTVCRIPEFSIVFPRDRTAFSTTRSIAFEIARLTKRRTLTSRIDGRTSPQPAAAIGSSGRRCGRIRTRPVPGVRYPPGPLTPGGCLLFRFPWVHVRSREEQMYSLFHVRRSTLVLGSWFTFTTSSA